MVLTDIDKDDIIAQLQSKIEGLEAYKHGEKIMFRDHLRQKTKFKMEPCPQGILTEIRAICKKAAAKGQLAPTKRINENGNFMEKIIQGQNPNVISSPLTLLGKGKSSGYPDLLYENKNKNMSAYLEVKVYNLGSENSSFRSFYVSTLDKITKTCPHLVIGFEHKNGILTGEYHVKDLYDLPLKVKIELSASNNDMYPKKVIPPTYSIHEIECIRNNSHRKREKQAEYRPLLKAHNLKGGGSADTMFETLKTHHVNFSSN